MNFNSLPNDIQFLIFQHNRKTAIALKIQRNFRRKKKPFLDCLKTFFEFHNSCRYYHYSYNWEDKSPEEKDENKKTFYINLNANDPYWSQEKYNLEKIQLKQRLGTKWDISIRVCASVVDEELQKEEMYMANLENDFLTESDDY